MNREDIIRMAKEAGWEQGKTWDDCPACGVFNLERFAALVAAAEREACAEVCDELHWPWRMGDNSGPKECAAAIRARGQV